MRSRCGGSRSSCSGILGSRHSSLDLRVLHNYISVVTQNSRSRMPWIWNTEKNRTNKRDHGLSFETARLVFNDPLAVSRHDPHPDEDRWQTVGMVGSTILFVVHTTPEPNPTAGEPTGRIISARKASADRKSV